MSYSVQINQVGRHGAIIGTPEIFAAETKDAAIALARLEVRRMPGASSRVMFCIFDSAHQLVLSYITTPATKSD